MPNDEQVTVEAPEVPLAQWKKSRNEGVKVAAPVVEEPKEEPTPEPGEQEAEKTEEEKHSKRDRPAEKRIKELTREREAEKAERAAAEKRREAAEKRAEEYEKRFGKLPSEDDPPKEEDFQDIADFYRAEGAYKFKQEQRIAQEIKAKKDWEDSFDRELEAARKDYPDFDEVVKDARLPWPETGLGNAQTRAFLDARNSSGMIGKLIYYFGANPKELSALKDLTPTQITMEVGHIAKELRKEGKEAPGEEEEEVEEQAEDEEKPEKKKLPTPITPVGRGASTTSKQLKDLPLSEYKKARNAGRVR